VKTFIFIFARGGSKGLPGKNLKKIGDKTLVEHSINIAKELRYDSEIIVSTDSNEIGSIAEKQGVIYLKRPSIFAGDDSTEWSAWQHGVKWAYKNIGEFERFVTLPPTAPLRNEEDVYACVNALGNKYDLSVTYTKAKRSPWFNQVVRSDNKSLCLVSHKYKEDRKVYSRRQEAPSCYDMTTVAYAAKPKKILMCDGLWDKRIKITGSEVPEERSIDIDNEIDYWIAVMLYERRFVK
jgi:CMP-N-acetylneuraminic acid synthetase|tara:strand:- start:269 stop:979 length:711 start_codon:yes stop_codon:yes gene_type:complete